MGQTPTEHTPHCMQEEEALPAWKTYKRRMRDERSREKRSSPKRQRGNSFASTNTRQIAEKEEEMVENKQKEDCWEKAEVWCNVEMGT